MWKIVVIEQDQLMFRNLISKQESLTCLTISLWGFKRIKFVSHEAEPYEFSGLMFLMILFDWLQLSI